MIDNVLLTKK